MFSASKQQVRNFSPYLDRHTVTGDFRQQLVEQRLGHGLAIGVQRTDQMSRRLNCRPAAAEPDHGPAAVSARRHVGRAVRYFRPATQEVATGLKVATDEALIVVVDDVGEVDLADLRVEINSVRTGRPYIVDIR